MSIKIYYFSGTGNSFAVAKEIAQKVEAELISIPKVMDRAVKNLQGCRENCSDKARKILK